MLSLNSMNKSSTRGIFLSFVLVFSITLITFSSEAYGDEITVKSIALGETTILELTNESDEEVNTLRIWLGGDFNFKSFKTEKGWVGEKNQQGVIIFSSSESIKPGEAVKFGVKTDKPSPGINWKALDNEDIQLNTGNVISGEIPTVVKNQNPKNTGQGIFTESTFRVIPEKPNVGSTIRVTGVDFGASQEFDFYIDTKKIGTFATDDKGSFMTTMKIPKDQKADRIDFKVIDKDGEEKKISLRIDEVENRIPESQNIPLTIKGVPEIVHRGDFLEIFGTGDPGSAITAEIAAADGKVINSRTAEIDSKGNWKLDEPVILALDTPFGKYSATLTDGRESKLIYWTVESDKKIIVTPISLRYDQGDTMKFNGTALPNIPIEIVLEDPLGKEIHSDIIQTDNSGIVKFEFPTDQNTAKGTYTLIATQEKDKEFTYVGLGQLPTIPVNLEFDKLSYKAGENATITLSGKASEIISLLIIDPSDKPKGAAETITLQPDGRGTHHINLKGYAAGVYTAVASKGTAQSSEVFTVGLQTGSGEIEIQTTKTEYLPGDSILVLGDTSPNVLLTITLIDPEGNEVKTKDTFSDKNGKIAESSFRIPSEASPGTWIMNAKSGSNFHNSEMEVRPGATEGMHITIEEIINPETSYLGKQIQIEITGAENSVQIEIIAEDGEVVHELSFQASSNGDINQPWIIPADTVPGTYTIRASDANNDAETTFEVQ